MILDATAIVSLLAGEAGADAVEALLDAHGEFTMSDWNRAEALDYFVRRGATVTQFDLLVDRHGIHFLAVDRHQATFAAEIRNVSYHRELCPVSLADCLAVALALLNHAELVTSDAGQTMAAGLFGCPIWAFKNSFGVMPQSSNKSQQWVDSSDLMARAEKVLNTYVQPI